MKIAEVKHSSKTNEHYTPENVIELCREVLIEIDLDPASSIIANSRVRAKKIYTKEDGLKTFEEKWFGNIFLNPPGGQKSILPEVGRSNPSVFWSKLMHSWGKELTVNSAIVLGFSLEVLQNTQGRSEPMLRFPLCVPAKRLDFDLPREEKIRQLQERASREKAEKKQQKLASQIEILQQMTVDLVPGEDPPHANVLVLVPPRGELVSAEIQGHRRRLVWDGPYTSRFEDVFSTLGYVRI